MGGVVAHTIMPQTGSLKQRCVLLRYKWVLVCSRKHALHSQCSICPLLPTCHQLTPQVVTLWDALQQRISGVWWPYICERLSVATWAVPSGTSCERYSTTTKHVHRRHAGRYRHMYLCRTCHINFRCFRVRPCEAILSTNRSLVIKHWPRQSISHYASI